MADHPLDEFMTPERLRKLLSRRLVGDAFVIQCDEGTNPPELKERGLVAAIVFWRPTGVVIEGNLGIDGGFSSEEDE